MYRLGFLLFLGAVSANGQLVNVTQLVQGKLKVVKPGVFKFVASVTLVETPGMKMIVDTTSPTDLATKDSLLQKLTSMNLGPEKINVLVLTHGHPDHAGQASMFPNAVL
ncbi:Protein C03F11.2, partial [Aphelenchoides avenae]